MVGNAKTKYDNWSQTSHKTQSSNNRSTQKDRHRELIFEVNSSKSFSSFLKFIDKQFTWYLVPLGDTVSKSKTIENKNDNILVPIIPLIYAGPECEPENSTELREGYLYIYKDNYLWRELKVLKGGFFKDVNLKEYQGKDNRTATVERDNRILLPNNINGIYTKIELCYSEIQWSWARINSLGGMDKKNFRVNKDKPPSFASEQGVSEDQSQKNRTARMQEMDLSGYSHGFPITKAKGNKSRVESSTSSATSLYTVKLHKKSKLPVVYLYDPIGVAKRNLGLIGVLKNSFQAVIERISKGKYYKSAILAYHTFFTEKLFEKKGAFSPCDDVDTDDYVDESDSADDIRSAKKYIDEIFLKKELKVKSRKLYRTRLRDLKTIHVEFMDGKYKEKNIIDAHSDFITFNDALKDFAELEAPNYSLLWATYVKLIGIMPFDPSVMDEALDIKADHDQVLRHEDPGHIYLKSILEPVHPLHEMNILQSIKLI